MNVDSSAVDGPRKQALRARNRRTGLILATIAFVFFMGVILKHTLLK